MQGAEPCASPEGSVNEELKAGGGVAFGQRELERGMRSPPRYALLEWEQLGIGAFLYDFLFFKTIYFFTERLI